MNPENQTLNGYYTHGEFAGRRVDSFPSTTPSISPTIQDLYGSVSDNDKFIDTSTSYYKGIAETPIDEAKVREDVMRRLQAEIDATNSIYAQKLSAVRQQGRGRLGSDAAIQARRGLLGSDFGAGQTGRVTDYNNEIEGGVLAEQQAAIAALYTRGENTIKAELEAKNAARAQGADAYIQFLGESEKRRTSRTATAAQLALASGVDLASLDKIALKALADSYQIAPDALLATFNQLVDDQSAAEAQAAKDALAADKTRADIDMARSNIEKNSRITLSEGQRIYDAFGNEIAYNPKTYKPDPASPPGNPGGMVGTDGKPLKLTATQIDTLTGFDNVIRAAGEAISLLKDKQVQTGPVAGLLLQGAKISDSAGEDQLTLEQTLAKIKADFMKALSGAAVSEPEVKRLSRFLPDIYDQEKVLETKLNTLVNESTAHRGLFLSNLGAVQSTSEGERRSNILVTPQGGTVDASALSNEEYQQALADGYKPQ